MELYADGLMGRASERHEMKRVSQLNGMLGCYVFSGNVPAVRSSGDYTARIMPHPERGRRSSGIQSILWQR